MNYSIVPDTVERLFHIEKNCCRVFVIICVVDYTRSSMSFMSCVVVERPYFNTCCSSLGLMSFLRKDSNIFSKILTLCLEGILVCDLLKGCGLCGVWGS